jgi:hypothetical protein
VPGLVEERPSIADEHRESIERLPRGLYPRGGLPAQLANLPRAQRNEHSKDLADPGAHVGRRGARTRL